MGDEICYMSAVELAAAYGSGELSPVECCTAMLKRIEALNPAINAYFHVDHEGARRAARDSEKRWREGSDLLPMVP